MPWSVRRALRWGGLVLALLAAAAFAMFVLSGRRTDSITATTLVERKPIVQSVVASGRVIAPQRVAVGSVVLGTAERVLVREGDSVKSGTVLVTLRSEEQRASLDQARSGLVEAEARIRQLETLSAPVARQALAQAESTLAFARQDHERTRKLYEGGFYGRAKLEESERNLEVALAQHRSAEAQFAANQKGSELQLALARRDQARAALELARVRLANTTVVAPNDGVVLKRMVEAGDAVQAGKVLFELSTGGDAQILLLVDEKNLPFIRVGQEARIAADAYPAQAFAAEVFFVAPGIDATRGTVEVKLRPREVPVFLRTDMTVSGELVVARKESALVVPSPAVIDARGRSPALLVVEGRSAVRRSVKLGLTGAGETEILDGVGEGERVVVPRPGANAGETVIPMAPR